MIRETTQICPNCQSENNIRFFDVVTADENIRKQLEEDRMFSYECFKCHKKLRLNYDCLFVDEKKEYALALLHENSRRSVTDLVSSFQYLEQSMKKRIVHDRRRVLEKIYVFSDGLNDYAVEVMKALLLLNLMREYGSAEKMELFYQPEEGGRFVLNKGKETYGLDFEEDLYQSLTKRFENMPEEEFVAVDYPWAIDLLSREMQQDG